MTTEEIKSEWKNYNQRLEKSQALNEKLLHSMLTERSRSRVYRLRKQNAILLLWMLTVLAFLIAIIAGNPFDFNYKVQFFPYILLIAGTVMAIASLVGRLKQFSAKLNNSTLENFLHSTIAEYEKAQRFQKWFGILIFSSGLLTVFSFLPKKMENKGIWWAMGDTAISVLITLAVYFIAWKAGAFKNRSKDAFDGDLRELNELKAISADLSDK